MVKKKVLIVDDMAINRSAIAGFLISKGFQFDQAEDGLKAVKLMDDNKYDLIFSDVEMPNMNGYELLVKIRRNFSHKNTPVIMLSTLDKPEEIEKAKKLGASHYIVKPFTTEKMERGLKIVGML